MSLLDQGIAHAAGRITLDDVRAMLGLADRARVIDLFELVMKGDLPGAMQELRSQYDAGADPAAVLTELAEFAHLVTRLKIVPEAASDSALTQAERVRGAAFAATLSIRVLSRAWQMLLKGISEVKDANRPLPVAEMVLVRLAHAADLPTPDEALRQLAGTGATPQRGVGGASAGSGERGPSASSATMNSAPAISAAPARPMGLSRAGQGGPQAAAPAQLERNAPAPRIGSLEDILALAARNRDIKLQTAIQRDLRPVRIEPGRLEFSLEPTGDRGIANELSRKLKEWTGQTWMVAIVQAEGEATLREQKQAADRSRKDSAAGHPAVKALMAAFPGARIVDVRSRAAEEAPPAEFDAGLAASLESGEGQYDGDAEPYSDIDF
jgi:DNA polymerase-3 subunit gamma/tau